MVLSEGGKRRIGAINKRSWRPTGGDSSGQA